MFVQTTIQELPSVGKSIYLAARVHNHVKVENTPFTGALDMLMSLIKDTEELSRFLNYLKNKAPDFSPIKKSSSRYMEDVDQSVFEKYIAECVYSFRMYNQHGDRAYKRNNGQVFNVLVNDEGDSYSALENLMVVQSNNPIERSKWRRKLPALLKRLHDKGKIYGLSTISCIRAMAIFKNQGKKVQDMTPGHFISYGVWKMDKSTGECTEPLTQNAGLFQSVFQYWLLGKAPDLVYNDLIEFIAICSKADIDLTTIDPKEYGESYIRTLITAYITPNNELVSRENQIRVDKAFIMGSNISTEVKRNLNDISLSEYLSGAGQGGNQKYSMKSSVSLATEIISMVKSSKLWNLPTIPDLSIYLYKITKQLDYIDGMFIDGVYCTKDAELKYLNMKSVIRDSQITLGTHALLFSTGHFVLMTKNQGGFLYIPLNFFKQYFEMKDNVAKSVRTFSIANERKNYAWGEWIPLAFS